MVGCARLFDFTAEVADTVVTFAAVSPLDYRQAHVASDLRQRTGELMVVHIGPLHLLIAEVALNKRLGAAASVIAEDVPCD